MLTFTEGSLVTNNPATSTSMCFTFEIVNDDDVEGPETVILGLEARSGLIIVQPPIMQPLSEATVTIIDNDGI